MAQTATQRIERKQLYRAVSRRQDAIEGIPVELCSPCMRDRLQSMKTPADLIRYSVGSVAACLHCNIWCSMHIGVHLTSASCGMQVTPDQSLDAEQMGSLMTASFDEIPASARMDC